MKNEGEREEVLRKFAEYLPTSGLMQQLHELDGLTIACWCKDKKGFKWNDKRCHCDILKEERNKQLSKENVTQLSL